MQSLRFQSVFDIIGPVMIGPSSSHTAGAVRIGKIVSSIFDDTPTEVEFQLLILLQNLSWTRDRPCPCSWYFGNGYG